MDSLKFLLYTLGRLGIFIAVNIFAAFSGKVLLPIMSSLFPEKSAISRFLLNETCCSVVAWVIMLIFLLVLFFDDGKRHAAYDIWNSINITIVLIFMLMIYYVPTVFRDSFHAEGKGKIFYSTVYFPVYWLQEKFGMKYTSSSALGLGIILVLIFITYVVSYKIYMKKHKSLYKTD
ncbi:MAG: hypothetical protein ACI4I7_05875 [Oscillospiraceae bacterium]